MRTNEEFKAEVFARGERFLKNRRKKRIRLGASLASVLCLAVLIPVVYLSLPVADGINMQNGVDLAQNNGDSESVILQGNSVDEILTGDPAVTGSVEILIGGKTAWSSKNPDTVEEILEKIRELSAEDSNLYTNTITVDGAEISEEDGYFLRIADREGKTLEYRVCGETLFYKDGGRWVTISKKGVEELTELLENLKSEQTK